MNNRDPLKNWDKSVIQNQAHLKYEQQIIGRIRKIQYASKENPLISIQVHYLTYSQRLHISLNFPPDLGVAIKEKLNQFQINAPANCRFNPTPSNNLTITFTAIEPGYKLDIFGDERSTILDINTIYIRKEKPKFLFFAPKRKNCFGDSLPEDIHSQIKTPLSLEQIEPLFPEILKQLPLIKRNLSFLQTLIWVFIQLEEITPEYIGLQELINDLCIEFKFYNNNHQLGTIFQQEKYDYDEIRVLLKSHIFPAIGIHAEQLYHHYISQKPLPEDWPYVNFDLNKLIELYQSLDESHAFYKTANHHLYHLHLLQAVQLHDEDKSVSLIDKINLLKCAYRSDDQELIGKAYHFVRDQTEQYYKHLVFGEHLPAELVNSYFNTNTLMQLYKKIQPSHSDYKQANYYLYHLQLHAEKIFELAQNKTALFQFAFRSGEQKLIDHAYNLLCGAEANHFTQVCGDEVDLIKNANKIQRLMAKEKELQSKLAKVQKEISTKLKPSQGGIFARTSMKMSNESTQETHESNMKRRVD